MLASNYVLQCNWSWNFKLFYQIVGKPRHRDLIFVRKHYLHHVSYKNIWIQAYFLSHAVLHKHTHTHTSWSNLAFKSCGLTQRRSFFPHTSWEWRENQKDTKSRLSIQWGENSFCHFCRSDYSGDPRPELPSLLSCNAALTVRVCIMKISL